MSVGENSGVCVSICRCVWGYILVYVSMYINVCGGVYWCMQAYIYLCGGACRHVWVVQVRNTPFICVDI